MSKRFVWDTEAECILEMAGEAVQNNDVSWLMSALRALVLESEIEKLETVFQADLNRAGYYTPRCPDPDCADCGGTGVVVRDTGFGVVSTPCICSPEHGSNY